MVRQCGKACPLRRERQPNRRPDSLGLLALAFPDRFALRDSSAVGSASALQRGPSA